MQTFVQELCAVRVKAATRISHEAAERVMMPLIETADTPQRYAALLQRLYGFYHPLENALQPFASLVPFRFAKSQLLLRDLAQLGLAHNGLFCSGLPLLYNEMQALGALYVLEGAALGGRIIARMLSVHSCLLPAAFSFFEGRGQDTGPHWNRFTQFLNNQAKTETQVHQVCGAAIETFERHTAWMQTL